VITAARQLGDWGAMKPTLDRSAAPMLVATFYPTITAAEVRAHFREIHEALEQLGRAGVVVDLSNPPGFLHSLVLLAGEEMRAAFQRGGDRLVGVAHVTPSAPARAMLAAVQWLAPPPFPTLVTSSYDEASSWVFARLGCTARSAGPTIGHSDARTVAGLGRALVACAQAVGTPVESCDLNACGISCSDLARLDGYLPYGALSELAQELAARSRDASLGLRAGATVVDSATLGIVGIAARASADLNDAFSRVARHARLIDENMELTLTRHAGDLRITPRALSPIDWPRQYTELLMAALLASSRTWVGVPFAASAVVFRHSAPKDAAEQARFFGCSPVFGASEHFIVIPEAVLTHRLPHGDAAQARYFDARLEELSRARAVAPGPLADVRAATRNLLAQGTPTVALVGGHLGLSGRTLQRRLNERGVKFGDILDSVRREAALAAIARPSASVQESAYSCGFTDVKAFRRAFVRWTGQSPSEYRRTHH